MKIRLSYCGLFVQTVQSSLLDATSSRLNRYWALHVHNSDIVFAYLDSRPPAIQFCKQLAWEPMRGPDLLSERSAFVANLEVRLRATPEYFQKCTLFEALLNQSLFNGFGLSVVNEVLQRLYYHFSKYQQSEL